MKGSLETPRSRGWKERFEYLPGLETQVESMLELFFLTSPFKFEERDLIDGLLELLLTSYVLYPFSCQFAYHPKLVC